MAYRVDLTARAGRNLRSIYGNINGKNSVQAYAWFNGLERAVLSLADHPSRCPVTPEDPDLRHLLYGARPDIYRVIFAVDHRVRVVTVLHVRHGAREALKSRGSRTQSSMSSEHAPRPDRVRTKSHDP